MKYITNTVKLYPNKSQTKFMDLTIEMCRLIYNTLLHYTFNIYLEFSKERKINLNFDKSKFAKTHKIPNIGDIKKGNDEYKKADSLALCNEYSNMVRGMQLFYNGHSKKPKFKRKHNDKLSYTTYQVNNNIRFEGRKLRLPKAGFIKARGIREFPNCFVIKCANVFKDKRGYYYASVVYEYPDNYVFNKKDKMRKEEIHIEKTQENNDTSTNSDNNSYKNLKIVGLDFKIDNIFVSSDNFIPIFPKKYFYLINKIPIVQKQINKKKRKSKNYYKQLDILRKIHRKIVNIRKNLQHQISSQLSNNYNVAVIEDLSMKQIVKDLNNGKNTYNTAFNSFIKKLSYKFNGSVIKISKWFPSSKKCSKCGNTKKHLKLSQRIYRCAYCGNIMDRDFNAAINIRNEGLRIIMNRK